MCGIAGVVTTGAAPGIDLRAAVERLQQALAHRGPDGWGTAIFDGPTIEERGRERPTAMAARGAAARAHGRSAVLGHRRLAIIDLTPTGHQPMTSAARRHWINYNGELYNYRLLRDELTRAGTVFVTQSDTEVLLALVGREGPDGLQRLRGMFAFAVWDDEQGTLLLARDRFGIKPLYYARPHPGVLVFASEIRALLASGLVSHDVDPDAEREFLARGSIPAPLTYFRHIRALPPGHWARWDGTRLTLSPYWSLDDVLARPAANADVHGVASVVRRAVTDSVGAHLVSDVPVGVFLSGGIDSALLVGAMRHVGMSPPRTFTVVVPGGTLDEAAAARRAAEYYGTVHAELTVDHAHLGSVADRFIAAMDQPTVDGLNTFVVADTAAQAGLKVALSGLGGDELLGGYPGFRDVPRLLRVANFLARIPGASGLAASALERGSGRAPKLAGLLRAEPTIDEAWRAYRALFTPSEVARLTGRRPDGQPARLRQRFGGSAEARQESDARRRKGWQHTPIDDEFWAVARAEMRGFMIPQLLRDTDVFTMTHGLEARTPLVDHLLLQAVHGAGRWRLDGAATHKLALARALGDFLPPGHCDLPKRGFTLPFDAWLKRTLSGAAGGQEVRARLNTPVYSPIVQAYLRGRLHWSRVWALYVLERFRAMRNVQAAPLEDPSAAPR